jgi:hypothetical protein
MGRSPRRVYARSVLRARWCRSVASAAARFESLFEDGVAALGVRRALDPSRASAMARAVLDDRAAWTADFGGEQFALGRAFYAHLETGRAGAYFASAARSDGRVERTLPGMQAWALATMQELAGACVRRRAGFAGPGVHVFPASGKVAREGGVVHFDLEGLTDHHLEREARAITLVVMLQSPKRGGGLVLWPRRYEGTPDTEIDVADAPRLVVRSGPGDALLVDSRRLHQIQRFSGDRDRISITVHAVEVDRDRAWEAWF